MQPERRRLPYEYAAEEDRNRKRPLPLSFFNDINVNFDSRDFVEGLLQDGELSLVFGESGCGKTFFATDLAFAVARGKSWRDREVDAGGVVYVAAEGAAGIRARIEAYRIAEGLHGQSIPFAVIASPLNLRTDDGDAATLVERIGEASKAMGYPVRLIVLDTISRVLAGGDENSSEAMGALVRNLDRLRHATGAHVMGVHHSGKDSSKGARGHSLLRAAVDTEIEVTRDNTAKVSTARVTKQRELETSGEWSFRLSSIELGINRRGKPVTSCTVQAVDGEASRQKPVQISPTLKRALDSLKDTIGRHGERPPASDHIPANAFTVTMEAWRSDLYARSVIDEKASGHRAAWKRIKDDLATKGIIGIWEEQVWLIGFKPASV